MDTQVPSATEIPNAARIYNYVLGGSHWFPADQAAAEYMSSLVPSTAKWVRMLRDFLQQAVNVLTVGKPGTGKSHIAAALGQELILQGHRVLWTATATLVQRLLAAKRDLRLPQALNQLDRYAWTRNRPPTCAISACSRETLADFTTRSQWEPRPRMKRSRVMRTGSPCSSWT